MTLGLGAAISIGSSKIYHDVKAADQKHEHIGFGIYLDTDTILRGLHSRERAFIRSVLSAPKELRNPEHEIFVAEILARSLHGDYEDEDRSPRFFPPGRLASSYFDFSERCSRGVCRHKALILTETLNALGIEARMQVNLGSNFPLWHAWVYLPEHTVVIDPTRGSLAQGFVRVWFEREDFPYWQSVEVLQRRMEPQDYAQEAFSSSWEALMVSEFPYLLETSLGGVWR